MIPIRTTPILFQPWKPVLKETVSTESESDHQAHYIELPSVSNYQELEAHEAFHDIQSQFLHDIVSLKQLARDYVGSQYDKVVDIFHSRLNTPPAYLQDGLLPLYRETRFHIHRLISQLKKNNQLDESTLQNQTQSFNSQGGFNKEYIASLLHDCLNGINLCPAGVHSRFSNSFLNMEASQEGLDGKLFRVRNNLYDDFIKTFLFQIQREGIVEISSGMEVHWFNGLHNLYCIPLALVPIDDPFAPTHMCDEIVQRFLSEAPLFINECTILRSISEEWSDRLVATMEQLGVAAWQNGSIAPDEITADRTEKLDSKLFKPVNHLLCTTEDQSLDLWTIIEENEDESYHLQRYREKLFAWATGHFFGSNVFVFTALPGAGRTNSYIGTIDHHYFWVFQHDQQLSQKQPCVFEADNHTTLQLSHLTLVDFSSWSDSICHAILVQAMAQTKRADELASFFLNTQTAEQLSKIPQSVTRMLSNQLSEKLLTGDDAFKKGLYQHISIHFADPAIKTVPAEKLTWLIDTPMMEPVLLELLQRGMDISQVTHRLNTWQISEFSTENMKGILTPQNCQQLFNQAVKLEQTELTSRLLTTGHCDRLINQMDDRKEELLVSFATYGISSGLKYLLKLGCVDVNYKNRSGWTPLFCAASNGHFECLEALLQVEAIRGNDKDYNGWTPLNSAARHGHWKCVRELVKAEGIRVNEENNNSWPPLSNAASTGHWECIRELMKAEGLMINFKDSDNWTPLNIAANNGHDRCVEELLKAEDILINEEADNGWTPLASAASNGRTQCVRLLLQAEGIDVNKKNIANWSPLNCAARNGYWKCVRELLTAGGIQVDEPNDSGCTPLNNAATSGHWKCVRELLKVQTIQVNKKNSEGLSPLRCAIKNNHWESVRELVKVEGIQLHEKDNNGFTPLHHAVVNGYWETVRELVKATNIRVNEKNNDGFTALHAAAFNGQWESIRELIKAESIRVNEENDNGDSPLNCAARAGHWEAVRELLKREDIDVEKSSRSGGWTPLASASSNGHWKCVRELLKVQVIQINRKNRAGWTPLGCAVWNGHWKCVRQLLAAQGIEVNMRVPYKRKTALMLAIKHRHQQCAQLLIQHDRTDINVIGLSLDTALTKARKKGLTEIVELLEADPRLNTTLDRFQRAVRSWRPHMYQPTEVATT